MIRIPALQPGDELLHLLAAAVSVGGTGVLHHRQLQPPGHPADLLLPAVQQGADLGDAGAVQVRHRLEARRCALEQQVHQQSLDGVVIVVAQGDLVAARGERRGVQRAFAHFGAGVKASIIFVRKRGNDEVANNEEAIFMAAPELIGYDATGRKTESQLDEIVEQYKEFLEDPTPFFV